MRISISKEGRTISIEREDNELEHLVDEFISCLLMHDYNSIEIKENIIKVAEILKNKE